MIADKTALESLISSGTQIPLIAEGSTESFALMNRGRRFFKIISGNSNTLNFSSTFDFSGVASGTHNGTITLLTITDNKVVDLGTIKVTTNFVQFSREVFSGEYYVAIASISGNYNANIRYASTNFSQIAILAANSYSGQTLSEPELTVDKKRKQCGDNLIYKVIDGELPPGLTMSLTGRIFGKVHEIDTMLAAKSLPPSVNMYFSDEYNSTTAIGLLFRFRVVVEMNGFPDVNDKKWYEILVLNNWSKDKVSDLVEFVKTRIVTFTPKMEKLAASLCIIEDEKSDVFIPTPIRRLDEFVMKDDVWAPIELPSIVVDKKSEQFKEWEDRYSRINKDSMSIEDFEFITNYEKTSAFLEGKQKESADIEIVPDLVLINGRNDSDDDARLLKLKAINNETLPMQIHCRNGTTLNSELTYA